MCFSVHCCFINQYVLSTLTKSIIDHPTFLRGMLHNVIWGVTHIDSDLTSIYYVAMLRNTGCLLPNEYLHRTMACTDQEREVWTQNQIYFFAMLYSLTPRRECRLLALSVVHKHCPMKGHREINYRSVIHLLYRKIM